MKYLVTFSSKAEKAVKKMPMMEKARFKLLIEKLEAYGPIRKELRNFSDLGKGKYHCHLSYNWVACWRWEKGTIEIEVYYAGSREKAPY